MGFWARLFGVGRKTTSLELFREVYGGQTSSSGVTVNIDTALQVATVNGICRVLCDGISQPPFGVYRAMDNRRGPARDHALYPLLHRRPNGWQTSFEFRESLMLHTVLTGNAFVFINRVGSDRRISELIQITKKVEVKQNPDYSLTYKVSADEGQSRIFPQDTIWHLRGPSWNTWLGMDAVRNARDAIGLSMALERSQSTYHKNGARVSGLLALKEKVGPEKYAELAAWVDKYEIGGERHNKTMILDSGAEFTALGMSGVDAQHLETRKHQIEEICRQFRVMPIMIGQSDKAATYASAEQMFLAHVVHTLSPWYERIEQSADVNLLTEAERKAGYYTKFTPNALMRGAAKDRAEFYAKALGSGGSAAWLTPNEVRALEDIDSIDGGDEMAKPITTAPSAPPSA